MSKTPKYNSDEIIRRAEIGAGNFGQVDLRAILRGAFIIEDGLRAYLHEKHGCAFVERNGKFSMVASKGKDRGVTLARNIDFLTMLEIALNRTIEE